MKNERSFINQIKIHQYFSRLFNSAVLLFIFSLLTFSLGIVNHYSNPDHVFYNLFSFSKQSNFLILLVSIMCLTPFKKSKFYFYI
ncbi:hypothetical protein, partial [Candidatus Phytoplasma phoenicium]|uniref:hypothetical protein n=1 Tax=Candidatus Phytoplasma phoenicium TaxID=198422 RepID=UPI000ACD3BAA